MKICGKLAGITRLGLLTASIGGGVALRLGLGSLGVVRAPTRAPVLKGSAAILAELGGLAGVGITTTDHGERGHL